MENPFGYTVTAVVEKMAKARPLAISYVRGSRRNPVPDRFDCVFATPDFEVLQCSYDYEGAIGAHSDHGFVLGGLILDEPSSKIHSNR